MKPELMLSGREFRVGDNAEQYSLSRPIAHHIEAMPDMLPESYQAGQHMPAISRFIAFCTFPKTRRSGRISNETPLVNINIWFFETIFCFFAHRKTKIPRRGFSFLLSNAG